MNGIRGLLQSRTHRRELPTLTIHAYLTRLETLPDDLRDPDNWDPQFRQGWPGLEAVRLGSALSSPEGHFSFSFDPQTMAESGLLRGQRNLWLAVTGASCLEGPACEQVVTVLCDLRVNAGTEEEFLICLDDARLIRLGLIAEANGVPPGVAVAGALRQQLNATASLATPPDLQDMAFSEFYALSLSKAREEVDAQPPRQGSFDIPLAIDGDHEDQEQPPAIEAQGGRLLLSAPDGGRPLPLTFAGLVRSASQVSGTSAASRVRVDTETGKFALVLRDVPDTLRIIDIPERMS